MKRKLLLLATAVFAFAAQSKADTFTTFADLNASDDFEETFIIPANTQIIGVTTKRMFLWDGAEGVIVAANNIGTKLGFDVSTVASGTAITGTLVGDYYGGDTGLDISDYSSSVTLGAATAVVPLEKTVAEANTLGNYSYVRVHGTLSHQSTNTVYVKDGDNSILLDNGYGIYTADEFAEFEGKTGYVTAYKVQGKLQVITADFFEEDSATPVDVTYYANTTNTITATPLANVTIYDRRYIPNYYSTLCVPFDLSEEQFLEALGSGAKAYELSATMNYDMAGTPTVMYRFVSPSFPLKAGTPYLVTSSVMVGTVVFNGVTIEEVEPATVSPTQTVDQLGYSLSFVGAYNPTTLSTSDYFFYAGNQLKRANGTTDMYGFRAYFHVGASESSEAKVLIDIDGVATAISEINGDFVAPTADSKVYNLNGQFVGRDIRALKQGVYVVNGKKVVVK